jgi:small subunit ribosomal protein S5
MDRYENSALMSDLVGYHNNCKVVLRAVPPGRGMRAGPLVREILEMMGVTDCSAKAYGNRNPYSVVRATYKALKSHEGLDIIARKRGKRVMSLARAKQLNVA